MRDSEFGRRRLQRYPKGFRLRAQLGGGQERQLGQGPGGQRRVGGPAHGPLPRGEGLLHCSSAAVYDPRTTTPQRALRPGDNHKPLFPTYSISKIAGEVVARSVARVIGLPTTIARLNVPYGDNGGWPFYHMEMMLAGIPIPVPPGEPARYNPIHEDDIIATIPKLLQVASVPATTVNWCGDQTVGLQEWCDYLGSLVGKAPIFEPSDQALRGNPTTVDRMHELIGGTTVDWREGIRRMAAKFHPELVGV